MRTVKVKQNEEKPVPIEILAESIKAISNGVKKLRQWPLTDKALVLLIQNAAPNVGGRYGQSRVGTTEIRAVIEGMEGLERAYLKKKPQ